MALHIFAIFVLLSTMFKYSLSVIAFPKNDNTWGLFKQFQADFGRRYYSDKEELFRFERFKNTVDKIAKLNSDPKDMATYAINDFADETEEEKRMRRGRLPIKRSNDLDTNPYGDWDGICTSCDRFPELAYPTPPPSLNWTRMGAVTPVVAQGKCGNCWAYGATGDVEGVWFLAGHRLTKLSQQQLTSCDHVGDDSGCLGASTCMDSFKYIMNNGGMASAKTYPDCSSSFSCQGSKPRVGTCNTQLASKITAWINGSYTVSGGSYRYNPKPVSEVRLKEVLTKTGPITIGINAEFFDYYFGGIIYQGSDDCPTGWNNLDHQALLTGYGVDNGYKYWIVKNTWGTRWGEAGYARIMYGINCCGIATDASHSFINKTS